MDWRIIINNEVEEIADFYAALKNFDEEEIEMLFDIGKRMLRDEGYKQYIVRETSRLKKNGMPSFDEV